MPRPQHNTTSLPRGLRDELGIRDTYGDKKQKRNGPANRKERRREERNTKKSGKPAAAPIRKNFHRGPGQNTHRKNERDEVDLNEDSLSDDAHETPRFKQASSRLQQLPASKTEKHRPLEVIDDEGNDDSDDDGDFDQDDIDLNSSDEEESHVPQGGHISKTVQAKIAQDDAEIAALEKKLGLKKGKKLPKAFAEDGLEDLMGDLANLSEDDGKKRKREADEWLQSKRQKALQRQAAVVEEDDEEEDDEDSDEEMDNLDDEIFGSEEGDDEEEDDDANESEFDGFDEKEKAPPKQRENPYVAPVSKAGPAAVQKYVPPSLRARGDPESEALTRLRRQAQGHLNKLSEANLVSILGEFEKLYRDYPRQHVTSTLITLLMAMIAERSALNDTFIVLHAGFIAAVYKIMGMDFGAEIVQKVVESMDAGGDERGKWEGKEYINLVSLLCQLYNFHVIGHPLMFDYIRLFLEEINETNTELLLKIIRNAGPQLRQDDPSALKDIVLLIQPAVARIGEGNLSVRTKFMIDTITDLKNNRVKNGIGANVTSEHITKMRKILGSLNNSRVIRASEPINITRADIHDSSKKGKWWLVGASWREDPLVSARQELSDLQAKQAEAAEDDSEAEPDLGEIARAHRMNTDVRRSIFVAIMSATDYQDAQVRLTKLRLKRAQEFEIPRVLLHCAMEEEAHNPYYTLIARRLCAESGRRLKMSFMFALWNIFKRMGEQGDEEEEAEFDADDEETGVSMKAVVNLAKMFGMLIADGTLTLGVLKNLNFAYLQPKTKTFVELLVISVIQQSQKQKKSSKRNQIKSDSDDARDEEALMQTFLRVQETPQAAKGLIYFIRKVVAKTDLVSEKEQKLVRWGCNVAVDALKAVKE
ncbi:hypothetical protein N7539_009271 [Penicillium diatomitis]|uniref:MI domain-containing protein n=1 Tax=Penicillium diatomitis TaxID=2819901 RepID=A0A9W9WM45_9EURO|nr:uncharacterized protein N7539_009271 [Penicillium diatomitis]KAJ5469653.1 hypothetical protein N7539_009271 [Penicillium diatomitis]